MSTLVEVPLNGDGRIPWNEIILQGIGTPTYDDRESEVKDLLLIVEDLIKRTTSSIPGISANLGDQFETIEDKSRSRFDDAMELFTRTITNISRELTCKPGENEDEKTLKIMKALANYSPKTRVALALAAFSIKYSKFRLLPLLINTNPLARTVALLKQQPEYPQYLKSWFNALAKLIYAMLELTKCIVDFKEPIQYINPENHDKTRADFGIPAAVYWTINSVVVCSSQIMAVLVMDHRFSAPYERNLDNWNLDDLTKKLKSSLEGLKKQAEAPPQRRIAEGRVERAERAETAEQGGLPEKTVSSTLLQILCLRTPSKHSERQAMAYQKLHSERQAMAYQKLHSQPEIHAVSSTFEDESVYAEAYKQIKKLFDTSHSDNMDVLKALVDQEDRPLIDGFTKERVSMDALKSKRLLLFISDLDLCREELQRFGEAFLESRTHPKRLKNQYEVVWLPVVDSSMPWKEKRNRFEIIQSWVPWYSIYYPSLISPAAIKYIKKVWKFNGKPMVVVLDSQGKVVNHNAIHMIRIWGSQAFPFTRLREEMLWKSEPCRIEFLVNSIDPVLTNWIADDKYICLYGGEDKEWIQRFTTAAREVASIANVPLELLYMGRSCPTEIDQSNISRIVSEDLSHVIQDLNLIKFFWLRLESIIESRESVINSAENDPLIREIKKLLDFDKGEISWALISRKGSMIMCTGNGEDVLKSFMEYNEWQDNAADGGFVPALSNYLHELQNPQNSNHPKSPEVSTGTHHRSNSNFLWRSLSCFADPPTK